MPRGFPLEFFMRPDFFDNTDDDGYGSGGYYRQPEPTRYYKARKKKKKAPEVVTPPAASNEEFQELVDAIFNSEPLSVVQQKCQYLSDDGYSPMKELLTQVCIYESVTCEESCSYISHRLRKFFIHAGMNKKHFTQAHIYTKYLSFQAGHTLLLFACKQYSFGVAQWALGSENKDRTDIHAEMPVEKASLSFEYTSNSHAHLCSR